MIISNEDAKEYLEHHGILGMHWGIRRYQNEDGTLTAAGRKYIGQKEERLTKEQKSDIYRKADIVTASKHAEEYSNKEMESLLERYQIKRDFDKQVSYIVNDNNTRAGREQIDKISNVLDTISIIGDKGSRAYDTVAKVLNAFNKNGKQLPLINEDYKKVIAFRKDAREALAAEDKRKASLRKEQRDVESAMYSRKIKEEEKQYSRKQAELKIERDAKQQEFNNKMTEKEIDKKYRGPDTVTNINTNDTNYHNDVTTKNANTIVEAAKDKIKEYGKDKYLEKNDDYNKVKSNIGKEYSKEYQRMTKNANNVVEVTKNAYDSELKRIDNLRNNSTGDRKQYYNKLYSDTLSLKNSTVTKVTNETNAIKNDYLSKLNKSQNERLNTYGNYLASNRSYGQYTSDAVSKLVSQTYSSLMKNADKGREALTTVLDEIAEMTIIPKK